MGEFEKVMRRLDEILAQIESINRELQEVVVDRREEYERV